MTLNVLIAIFGIAGLVLFAAAIRRFRRGRVVGGLFSGITALTFWLLAACILLIGANVLTYRRLTAEQPAAELQFSRIGDREFNAVLTYPDSQRAAFALRGDEWQIDARILKWRGFAELLGFDAAYRLERIAGRYSGIEDERSQPHTVYPLNPPGRIELWDLLHRYHQWMPWTDALYGSAAYLPMADGALYQITVSQSGLVARPLNQAARDAISNWH
jgi:hypothetical protein